MYRAANASAASPAVAAAYQQQQQAYNLNTGNDYQIMNEWGLPAAASEELSRVPTPHARTPVTSPRTGASSTYAVPGQGELIHGCLTDDDGGGGGGGSSNQMSYQESQYKQQQQYEYYRRRQGYNS